MIAAAAHGTASHGLPFNWFDIVVFLLLLFGLYRGRRNGMSKEFLPFLQWIVLVPVCGFLYPFAGQFYINTARMDKMTSYVCGYVTLGFIVLIFFGIVRRLFAERMGKSDTFRGGEYYLGPLAGIIRVACMILVALALLNAPVYSQAEIQQHALYVKNTYGGGLYAGNYFPTVQQIQEQVFKDSFIGPVVKKNVSFLLIKNAAPSVILKPNTKPVHLGNKPVKPAK